VLRSAHDCSDGGLAVALAECVFRGEEPGLGGKRDLPSTLRLDGLLSRPPGAGGPAGGPASETWMSLERVLG
jgi:hypothetical protein